MAQCSSSSPSLAEHDAKVPLTDPKVASVFSPFPRDRDTQTQGWVVIGWRNMLALVLFFSSVVHPTEISLFWMKCCPCIDCNLNKEVKAKKSSWFILLCLFVCIRTHNYSLLKRENEGKTAKLFIEMDFPSVYLRREERGRYPRPCLLYCQ